ncbi:MAG: hypothetical protein J5802_00320 [Butyrivibrio sp.]|nr:hypothetical protein [Butyrivibrio sp.]
MKHIHKKKSNFFTFIFSFVPGCAEMYMGFMNNGLSLLAVFMLACMLSLGCSEILLVTIPIIWFYGFFHAHKLAGLDDETFDALEDNYIWDELAGGKSIVIPKEKQKKIISYILIFVGAGILWNCVTHFVLSMVPGEYWHIAYIIVDRIPGNIVAVLLIVFGIKLIKGKKKQIDMESEDLMDGYDNQSA